MAEVHGYYSNYGKHDLTKNEYETQASGQNLQWRKNFKSQRFLTQQNSTESDIKSVTQPQAKQSER